ncbi:hypothetical protein NDA18_004456 [Ustilago nuda]|nr:hypothetical protein NDA18_004456 [Ustilago nuda]
MPEATAAAAQLSLPAIENLHLRSDPSSSSSATPSSQSGRGRNRGNGRGRGRGKNAQGTSTSSAQAAAGDHNSNTASTTEPSSSNAAAALSQAPSTSNPRRKNRRGGGSGGKPKKANGATSSANATDIDVQPAVAPARLAARRQQFGGKLTGGANDARNSKPAQNGRPRKPAVKVPAVSEPVEYADLRSRLLAELSSGEYDCVICYNTVTTRQATWSCSQCYSVLHLPCVRKWAESSVKKAEEHNATQEDPEIRNRRGTWRCPGCQYASEDVPKIYWYDSNALLANLSKGGPPLVPPPARHFLW